MEEEEEEATTEEEDGDGDDDSGDYYCYYWRCFSILMMKKKTHENTCKMALLNSLALTKTVAPTALICRSWKSQNPSKTHPAMRLTKSTNC